MASIVNNSFSCVSGADIHAGSFVGPTIVGSVYTPTRDALGYVKPGDWLGFPLNSWKTIYNLKWRDVAESPNYPNQGGGDSFGPRLTAWGSMARMRHTKKVYSGHGSGHTDGHECETPIDEFDLMKLQLRMILARSPLGALQSWNGTGLDGTQRGLPTNNPLLNGRASATHHWKGHRAFPPAVMRAIPGASAGNQEGGIFIPGACNQIFEIDTLSYLPAHWLDPNHSPADWSSCGVFPFGNKLYGVHAYYWIWQLDLTQTEATQAGAASTGKFTKLFSSGSQQHNVGNALFVDIPELGIIFSVANDGTRTRTNYAAAFTAHTTSGLTHSAWQDTFTFTSSDGSHLDFLNDANYNENTSPTPCGPLYQAGTDYDAVEGALYVQRNDAGGRCYKLTTLTSSAITTQYMPSGTAALTASTRGTMDKFGTFSPTGNLLFAWRVTTADNPIELMRLR